MYLEAYVNSASKSMNFTTGNIRETSRFKGLEVNGHHSPQKCQGCKETKW